MTTESAQSNEERVQSVWIEAQGSSHHQYGRKHDPIYWEIRLGDDVCLSAYDTEAEAWDAAWEYTEAVLKEVRQLKDAIELMEDYRDGSFADAEDHNTCSFILARLQSLLAAKSAGLKPEAL